MNYKNAALANYLVDNFFTLDQCDSRTEVWVKYIDLDGSTQEDFWTLRTLWDEIEADEITLLCLEVLGY